jgi:hypothetical protein
MQLKQLCRITEEDFRNQMDSILKIIFYELDEECINNPEDVDTFVEQIFFCRKKLKEKISNLNCY